MSVVKFGFTFVLFVTIISMTTACNSAPETQKTAQPSLTATASLTSTSTPRPTLPSLPSVTLPAITPEQLASRGRQVQLGQAYLEDGAVIASLHLYSWDLQAGNTVTESFDPVADTKFFMYDEVEDLNFPVPLWYEYPYDQLAEMLGDKWTVNPTGGSRQAGSFRLKQYVGGPLLTYIDLSRNPFVLSDTKIAVFGDGQFVRPLFIYDTQTGAIREYGEYDNIVFNLDVEYPMLLFVGRVESVEQAVLINLETGELKNITDQLLEGAESFTPPAPEPDCQIGSFLGMVDEAYAFERRGEGNTGEIVLIIPGGFYYMVTDEYWVATEGEIAQIEPILPDEPLLAYSDYDGYRRIWAYSEDFRSWDIYPTWHICGARPSLNNIIQGS